MIVPMAHRVVEGTRTGLDRFRLRVRLGRSARLRLAERIERYVTPHCAGCGAGSHGVATVTAAGNVWWLCESCADRARS